MHKNQLEHDKRYKAKQAAAGNTKCTVVIPADCRDELKAIARIMRDGLWVKLDSL